MPEPGITNLGKLDKDAWIKEVAESAVLVSPIYGLS